MLEGITGIPQHLYIIFTDSLGERTILRGGAKNDQMMTENIKIIKQRYE